MKKKELIKLKVVEEVIKEMQLISTLDHPFIVKFHGLAQNNKVIYICQELVMGKDLSVILLKKGQFKLDEAKLFISQIVSVVEYLQASNVVYRGLKPEDFKVDDKGYLRLVDLSYSRVTSDLNSSVDGSLVYKAPEFILNAEEGKEANWWACGVILFEMLTGENPFYAETPTEVYTKIVKGTVRFPADFDALKVKKKRERSGKKFAESGQN